MISGLVLKYLNGECFVIRHSCKFALPASIRIAMKKPATPLSTSSGTSSLERLETGLYRGFGPVNGIALTPATRIGCQYLDCNRFSIK